MAVTASAVADDSARPSPKSRPPELGTIHWQRGFDAAAAEAKRTGKPVLVLFQEVPGCGTCKGYGRDVLSHPLIRDAVETLFAPVAVYNNIKGDDERVLKRFKEPAWNNPVVRIMRPDGTMLANRVAKDYSTTGLVSAMVAALEKEKRDVPAYLRLLHDELSARKRGLERATFEMHCFWEGEGQLGSLDGVVATLPGFVQGKEVVDVWFDATRVTFPRLLKEARKMQCARGVFARTDAQTADAKKAKADAIVRTDEATRPDKAPKYYLSRTAYRFIPMTATQASRVNGAIREKRDPKLYLAPCQLMLLANVKRNPKAAWPSAVGEKNLITAFAAADRVAAAFNGTPRGN